MKKAGGLTKRPSSTPPQYFVLDFLAKSQVNVYVRNKSKVSETYRESSSKITHPARVIAD
jgi:hypothetical protein